MSSPRENLAAHLYRMVAQFTGRPAPAWDGLLAFERDLWLRAADEAMAAMGVLPVEGFLVGDCFEACGGHS